MPRCNGQAWRSVPRLISRLSLSVSSRIDPRSLIEPVRKRMAGISSGIELQCARGASAGLAGDAGGLFCLVSLLPTEAGVRHGVVAAAE